MLGIGQAYDEVPFFWTHHYGVDLRVVGHANHWDQVRIDGQPSGNDATARFYREGRLVAAASLGRDLQNLAIEAELGP